MLYILGINMIKNLIKKVKIQKELPFEEVHDTVATVPFHGCVIPPNVYQTWASPLFGRTHASEIRTFRSLNPDLNFILYDDRKLASYMEEFWGSHPIHKVFKESKFGPMKADIFRYCILHERGGFYFDISKGCSVPISSLCSKNGSALISYEAHDCVIPPGIGALEAMQFPGKYLLQWGMGFSKGHTVLQHLIENICEYAPFYRGKCFEIPKNAILSLTGPGMFTKTIRDVMAKEPALSIDQAGVDFNHAGIYCLKGSWARYSVVPAYTDAKNEKIFD